MREDDDVPKRQDRKDTVHAHYMGEGGERRNKAAEQTPGALAESATMEWLMAEDREKISNGPNERAVNETIAGTGPGIHDDALAPGEELPEPPSEEEVRRTAERMGAPLGRREEFVPEGK